MIRILRHTLCLALLLTLAACSKEEPGYNPPAVATQTLLLYMPGRGLINYYERNIEGVSAAVTNQIPGDGRILVCYQPEKHSSAVMLEIYYDRNKRRSETKTLKTYDGFNAGNPEKVRQLFADAAELAPAQNYGLIIGCHGKAWIPVASGSLSYSMRRSAEDDLWAAPPGAKQTRSFGDKGYELNITELKEALEAQQFRFDYLIFDDCFMANIETLYDLRSVIGYIVASPCEVMGDGFPLRPDRPPPVRNGTGRGPARGNLPGVLEPLRKRIPEHDLERAVGLHLTGRHVAAGRAGGSDAPHQRKKANSRSNSRSSSTTRD